MPIFAFLLGCVTGLRSMTGPALVCWGAHFGWLHLVETRLGFLERTSTLVVFTLLALGELVVDKLPNTPPRTALLGMSARIVLGATCGYALALSSGGGELLFAAAAVVGAVAGAFAGINFRRSLAAQTSGLIWLGLCLRMQLRSLAGWLLCLVFEGCGCGSRHNGTTVATNCDSPGSIHSHFSRKERARNAVTLSVTVPLFH